MQTFTRKDFPYSIRKLKGVIHNKLVDELKGQPGGLVQVGPEKWILPASYEDFAEQIYNFEARPDDVYICTFPRSGTTWTQEMIWLICNDLDYETAMKLPLNFRFPFLE
jgi:Sulfotransferase domain